MIEPDGTVLVAAVRVEHSVTGEILGPVRIEAQDPSWTGFSVSYRRDHALLTVESRDLNSQPQEAPFTVHLDDPVQRALVQPAQSSSSLEVWGSGDCQSVGACMLAGEDPGPRGDAAPVGVAIISRGIGGEHVISVDPVPTTLEIMPVDSFGRGIRGLSLEVQGRNEATSVALVEVDSSCVNSPVSSEAVYRSCPPQVWDRRFYPFQIVVGGHRVGERVVNYWTRVTRHRLVVPMTHTRA